MVLLYLFDLVQHATRAKVFSYLILTLPSPDSPHHELSTLERYRDESPLSSIFPEKGYVLRMFAESDGIYKSIGRFSATILKP